MGFTLLENREGEYMRLRIIYGINMGELYRGGFVYGMSEDLTAKALE